MSELLPCPFCGGAARDAEPHNKRCSPRIECSKCYIGISAMNCESERSEAVDAWNTRATQHLPSENEALAILLKEYKDWYYATGNVQESMTEAYRALLKHLKGE